MTQRFDLRRRSAAGIALGDPVTAEQTAEAETYIRAYTGQRRFLLAMQSWLTVHGTISRKQVAAILQMKTQETA